jgi:hypothetical protein
MSQLVMQNPTLLLPGFHLSMLRKKSRSMQQILVQKLTAIKRKSLSQLGETGTGHGYQKVASFKRDKSENRGQIKIFTLIVRNRIEEYCLSVISLIYVSS